MTLDLTEPQKRVLLIISNLSRENGVCPSLDEISTAYGKSKGSVRSHIRALIGKNYIVKRGEHRAIVVINRKEANA